MTVPPQQEADGSRAVPQAPDLRRHLSPARRRPTTRRPRPRPAAGSGSGRALRGVSRIQRGQLTPALQHFGSATSRTRATDVTPDHASPEDRAHTTARTHPLTTGRSDSLASSRRSAGVRGHRSANSWWSRCCYPHVRTHQLQTVRSGTAGCGLPDFGRPPFGRALELPQRRGSSRRVTGASGRSRGRVKEQVWRS